MPAAQTAPNAPAGASAPEAPHGGCEGGVALAVPPVRAVPTVPVVPALTGLSGVRGLQMLGADDSGVCVDGVCAVPEP